MASQFQPINMDYSKTVIKSAEEFVWVQSPNKEVFRCQLERELPETGWATSLVRYPRGSQFKAHTHPGGEQFFVLEGTFSDERGDFPENTYVQNPVGSMHAPFSENGCLIFVRLGAVSPSANLIVEPFFESTKAKAIKTGPHDWLELRALEKGQSQVISGVEILLVDGELSQNGKLLTKYSWARVSKNESLSLMPVKDSKILLRPLLR